LFGQLCRLFLLHLFGRQLGYEVLQKFALLGFVADGKAVILILRIHQLLEMVVVVLCRRPERPIRGSDFSFLGACGVIIPLATTGIDRFAECLKHSAKT
jgi:hypothetical protein